MPDRACLREDGGPLRGDQQQKSPSISSKQPSWKPLAGAPVRGVDAAGHERQPQGRVPLPPEELRVVLAPVDLVWARLERPAARRLVEAAARIELARLAGFTGRADAPKVLADRIARRLEDQMRLGGPIADPVGWLIGRALPQRQQCGDARCDDRVLLDSGQDCPWCEDRQAERRATRHTVAAAVDASMPGASEAERRAATDRQLHEAVTAQAWIREHRWAQVREQQAAAAQARAEAAAAQPAFDVPAAPAAPVVVPAPRLAADTAAPAPGRADVDQELILEDLTREQVLGWRDRAAADHQIVLDHIARYGEHSAQRLFTRRFVATVQRLSDLGHLDLGYTPWGQA
ncbi:hypothetical protein HET69_40580 [Streptomyces sp. CJ_13]|uniref:hypothetical protein n=1 Tax=Streptomyces sp. CJ_13 TaxID=2724943 RepID=UPI001BDC63DB|nr:hypothetical protein [Streptomyces sp. CJ_13]MBT1190108.1 hypothetical protein [Streptomyces sp. CJ_13]